MSAIESTDVADLFGGEPPERAPVCRPHCSKCGRWVPEASVVRRAAYFDPSEDDWSGTCKVHGERVDVTWDEM